MLLFFDRHVFTSYRGETPLVRLAARLLLLDVYRHASALHKKGVGMDIELDDAGLARRIGGGNDSEAEAELFRRMAPRIRLYGLRHLRDEHGAEDLTQHVLITTIETLRAGRLRDRQTLASFVREICRMSVLELRRNAQRRRLLLDRFGADLAPPAQAPVPRLDHEQLSRCVQQLKERERTVVVMTF